ncbi:hypothetical protein GJAV_G00264220 [Gymnothorax javanicus]|nr:hypothetical protein GJAV_G00264220 [Gymnothorax javanicus]
MACSEMAVWGLSRVMIVVGFVYLLVQTRRPTPYGRYATSLSEPCIMIPSRMAWLILELPAFLIPVALIWGSGSSFGTAYWLLSGTFCVHYFHRCIIYPLLTKGRPFPLRTVIAAFIFCTANGYLQGHYILHCGQYDASWLTDIRLPIGEKTKEQGGKRNWAVSHRPSPLARLTLFLLGMAINIHSDHILRNLRNPGEVTYKIPRGGMFEYVSGANFFGEIVEWCGFAIATWSLPALSFALFTMCSIGPRAYHHHRFYQDKFEGYPRSRKALVPFIF